VIEFGAMAEGLGKGLQNLLHQFKSGSRLKIGVKDGWKKKKASF
jgi:hypothetical protein